MCVCLLADVASKEQQQSAKDSSKDQEEEEIEDAFMDMEEQEELTAVDPEQLKPEEFKSGTMASPSESYREPVPAKLSDLEKSLLLYCSLVWSVLPRPNPWLKYPFACNNFTMKDWGVVLQDTISQDFIFVSFKDIALFFF